MPQKPTAPLPDGFVPDSGIDTSAPLPPGFTPDAPANTNSDDTIMSGASEMGSSFLDLFKPFHYSPADENSDYITKKLGFQLKTPPQIMAEGMVKSATDAAQTAYNKGDIANADFPLAAAQAGDISGFPFSPILQNLRAGKPYKAAGEGLAGLGIGYLAHRAGGGPIEDVPPDIGRGAPPDMGGGGPIDFNNMKNVTPRKKMLGEADFAGDTNIQEGDFTEVPPVPMKELGPGKPLAPREDAIPVHYNEQGAHNPTFANDIDKAMWMVGKLKPSKKYSDYLEFVQNQTGLEPARAVQMSKEFKDYVESYLDRKGPGTHSIPETYGSDEWNNPGNVSKMENEFPDLEHPPADSLDTSLQPYTQPGPTVPAPGGTGSPYAGEGSLTRADLDRINLNAIGKARGVIPSEAPGGDFIGGLPNVTLRGMQPSPQLKPGIITNPDGTMFDPSTGEKFDAGGNPAGRIGTFQGQEPISTQDMGGGDISEMARPTDLRVGQSGYGQGSLNQILQNSPTEELIRLRQQVADDVTHWQGRVGDMPNNREATGMIKRRVAMAQTKLAAIDSAISTRNSSNEPLISEMGNRQVLGNYPDSTLNTNVMSTAPYRRMRNQIDQLKVQQDAAYRAGDTKTAVELGQHMQELDRLLHTSQRNMGISRMGEPDEHIGMEVGDREDMIDNMIGQYAEHGLRVANKELLQNGIDAVTNIKTGQGMPGGKVSVDLDYHATDPITGDPSYGVTVKDNGPGLPIDLIRKEYVTLTGSGKRGKGISIGEMGVGKATYLLGTEAFHISTVAREPDGSLWHYDMTGTPQNMRDRTLKINKQQVPEGTPTGTEVTVYDKNLENLQAAKNYLSNFSTYSKNPVQIDLKSNEYATAAYQSLNLNKSLAPRTVTPGKFVTSGSAPGADYVITVPDEASWHDSGSVAVVLTNRGMFQGVDTIYLGSTGNIPDHVNVEIQPTVSAKDAKNYPLTSPTRERMKDPFKNVIREAINKDIMEAAKKKREGEIQKLYDGLQPIGPGHFVVYDPGGRYTNTEMSTFVNSPVMAHMALVQKNILDHLNSIFQGDTPHLGRQLGQITKSGFVLGDVGSGGLNVSNPNSPHGAKEFAIMTNPVSVMQVTNSPKEAAQLIVHAIAHEFTHNFVRSEGGKFTWALAKVFAQFDLENQVAYKDAILKAITGPDGRYLPNVEKLLQDHTNARGRQDTTLDLLSKQRDSEFLGEEGSDGISRINEPNRKGVNPEDSKTGLKREAFELSRTVNATMDMSGMSRQSSFMIGTPEWFKAIGPAFKGLWDQKKYDQLMAAIEKLPVVEHGVAKQGGLRLTDLKMNRAETTQSKLGEKLPYGIGAVIRGSNRHYTLTTNLIRANYLQRIYDTLSTDEKANPNLIRQICTAINDASGHGKYEIGIAPRSAEATGFRGGQLTKLPKGLSDKYGIKQNTSLSVNLESWAPAINTVMFSGRNRAATWRMLFPGTYINLPPKVRNIYLAALMRKGLYWYAMAQLLKSAGGTVDLDPRSADFLKIRFGDLRIDPGAGTQQAIVFAARLASGQFVSSLTNKESTLGTGFKEMTRKDLTENYLTQGLHPMFRYAYDLANASEYAPFHPVDRTIQLFVPMISGDAAQIAQNDPKQWPAVLAGLVGMGVQTYSKGSGNEPVHTPWIAKALGTTPDKIDYNFTGGPLPYVRRFLGGNPNQ